MHWRSLLSVLMVAVLTASGASPARGHKPSKWYGARWSDNVVVWRFDRGFPKTAGARRAVRLGARQWNRAGARLRFAFRRGDRAGGAVSPCSQDGANIVHWGPIDGPGGKLAITAHCTFDDGSGPRGMHRFEMVFDSAEDWNLDPSGQPDVFENDLWAVATHEFGHASGRVTGGPDGQGHFSESSTLCPDLVSPRRHTMCPADELIGVSMRTLERHDIDVFRKAYGRR